MKSLMSGLFMLCVLSCTGCRANTVVPARGEAVDASREATGEQRTVVPAAGQLQSRCVEAPAQAEAVNAKPDLTVEPRSTRESQIITIAKEYKRSHGGLPPKYEIEVVSREEKWYVTFWGLPKMPGGFSVVVVSNSGQVTSVMLGQIGRASCRERV